MLMTIEIELEEDKFNQEDFADEISHYLRQAKLDMTSSTSGNVRDALGNVVGIFEIE